MKRIVVGILAHVDSGKTTLSEGMLYKTGAVRKLGRVDHGNAFLDTYELERKRGITIFSKQALFSLPDTSVTLLDTPGHVDFSAEMERTLQVLDYAILVISGTDGVQSHTRTLWRLLRRHHVPTFIFINKMDLAVGQREAVLEELRSRLSTGCIDFSVPDSQWMEEAAACDEEAMEFFFEQGRLETEDVQRLIAMGKVYPCFWGSALKLEGIDKLLEALDQLTLEKVHGEELSGRIFKIARDQQGSRLTYLKITGGCLRVRDVIETEGHPEKINQIRIYSGSGYKAVDSAYPGQICAVTGLSFTKAGMGIGSESGWIEPLLEPVLTYRVILPEGADAHQVLEKMQILQEEDPQLHVTWKEALQEIHVQLMGAVQIEILKSLVEERFGISVEFGAGNILYKETIKAPVEGAGHFEPLRHYAEVHLLLEPGDRGSGLQFDTTCSTDALDINWQRLILTHLREKSHVGVLTGSPITDMKITLTAGKAHLKHTEGGDFRQATYRAVRQGLMQVENILLEPWYDFQLDIPSAYVGRAMADLMRMDGVFDPPQTDGDRSVLYGRAPVATMRDYVTEVAAYTKGQGHLACTLRGYEPCHNPQEVISQIGYDPLADTENTPDSVFCSHGAGVVVKWDEATERMHVKSPIKKEQERGEEPLKIKKTPQSVRSVSFHDDKELMAIFEQTYGPIKRDKRKAFDSVKEREPEQTKQIHIDVKARKKEYLLVDGYNIIFAWDELKEQALSDLDLARESLIRIMSNYRGYKKCELILVFDAYKVKGGIGSIERTGGINVVYTKEAETADMYIEKVAHELSKEYRVRVATSDGLEQLIILGAGAQRLPARQFHEEVCNALAEIRKYCVQR